MFGDLQDAAPAALAQAAQPSAVPSAVKEIPYDYVATFQLLGLRGNRVQDVINISIDGAFVAVAVGYSFVPASFKLPDLPVPVRTGLLPTESIADWLLRLAEEQPALSATIAQSLLTRLGGIDFKYSVVDSGSGRELQNRPIHNLAGLGEATGDRPFRPFAKPMMFMPRSTIRIEIEEISEGAIYAGAQLFIVLHGYKLLGYGSRP
jgi:hypothetical protein